MDDHPPTLNYAPIERCPRQVPKFIKPSAGVLLMVVGGPLCGLLLLAFPCATACDAIGLSIPAGLFLAFADFVLLRRTLGTRSRWLTNAALIVAIVLAWGFLLVDGPKANFAHAFGIVPPRGVRNLHVEKRYMGGPGDTLVVMTFTANQATIDALVKARPLAVNQDAADFLHQTNDWQGFCRQLFSGLGEFGRSPTVVPRMSSPHPYHWENSESAVPIESIDLLWDGATGNAYAQWTSG